MAHSHQILNELITISELVANLPVDNPYKVPAGYFEGLPNNLMAHIATLNPNEVNTSFTKTKYVTPYKVPATYFDELAGNILKRIQLQEATPQNGESEEALSSLLIQLKKTVPFKLPERYFDEFPSDFVAGVNAVEYVNQELEAHAPIITDLKIKNAYQVPDGYFDNLDQRLLYTVKSQRKTKGILINFNKRVLRYSMAALIAGVVSVAAWMFFQNKPAVNTGGELANMEKISNDEMMAYLDSTTDVPGDNSGNAFFTMKEDDVKELLTDLPDEELQQYLDQQAISKDLKIN